MFDSLYHYFEEKSSIPLAGPDRLLISERFRPRKLRKKQYFLQEREICKSMAFIVKGASRMYSIDEKGHEHILRFGIESWWIGDYESYNMDTPSCYNIDMLEDSELLTVTLERMQELIAKVPAVALTVKKIDQRNAITTQQRIHSAISLTAEERYEAFVKAYPAFIQRFSQNMIASYLGITPETLSRIKRNMLHK